MARLEIIIEAEAKAARRDLSGVSSDLRNVERSTKQVQRPLSNLSNKTMPGISKSTNLAATTMTSFSQGVQDVPFGLRGITNNAQQVVQQFGLLATQTGSATKAIRAMWASLAGPAGILLAFSAISSALLIYEERQRKAGKETEKQKKKVDELAESLKEYQEGLRGVNASQLEGQRDAAKELTTLRLLTERVEDTTLSIKERTSALNELRRLYPSYFQQLNTEKALANGLTSQYNELTKSILAKARAQAAEDIIVENTREELLIKQRVSDINDQITKQEAKNAALLQKGQALRSQTANTFIRQAASGEELVNKLTKERNELLSRQQDIIKENTELSKEVQQQGGTVPLNFDLPENPEQQISNILQQVGPVGIPVSFNLQEGISVGVLAEQVKSGAVDISEAFKLMESGAVNSVQNIQASMQGLTRVTTDEQVKQAEEILRQKDLAESVSEGMSSAFSGLATSMVSSLDSAGSGFEAFASKLKETAIKLIAMLLSQSIANAITGATQSGLATGPAAVFTTPAFIASAVAGVIGAFAAIPSFAKGGFSGDDNLAMLNRNELVLRPMEQAALFNAIRSGNLGSLNTGLSTVNDSGSEVVEFRLEGTTMVGALKRTLRSNNRRGGNITL